MKVVAGRILGWLLTFSPSNIYALYYVLLSVVGSVNMMHSWWLGGKKKAML